MKFHQWITTFFAALILGLAPAMMTGCEEGDAEDAADDVGDAIEDGVDDAGDAIEEGGEELEDEYDDATTD